MMGERFLAPAAAALTPSRSWMRWAIPIFMIWAASSAGPMKSKGTLRGISNVTESGGARRWRGGRARLREVKFSFACQKRTRKAPATFEAREARIKGCSPLIIPKQLGSIQKIQAATLKDFLCYADLESLRDSCRLTAAYAVNRYDPYP